MYAYYGLIEELPTGGGDTFVPNGVPNAPPATISFETRPVGPLALSIPVSTPPVLNAPAIHTPFALGLSEPPTRPLSLAISINPRIPNAPHDFNPLAIGRSEPPAGPRSLSIPVSTPPVANAPQYLNPLAIGRSEPSAIGWPSLQITTLGSFVFNPPAIHTPFREGRSEPPSPGYWRIQFQLANPAILTNTHDNNPLAVGRSEPPAIPRSGLAAPTPYSMAWHAQWDQPNYSKPTTEPTARTFIPLLPPVTTTPLRQRTLTGVGL